jgi:uncharacterized membrane protein YtjA (UPF0391 family)
MSDLSYDGLQVGTVLQIFRCRADCGSWHDKALFAPIRRKVPACGEIMLHYAVVFFVIALIAALLGFSGLAAGAAGIAKVLFLVFLVIAVATFILGQTRKG